MEAAAGLQISQPSPVPCSSSSREKLWDWLNNGAHLYVCGDATRMAKDVDRTLRDIAVTHGGLDEEQAEAYVRQLATDRRYVRDVY